ncbi:hypothetical protein R1flu_012302 [Riccia fluitans]|uniref:M23ase beta-sheet core domain-containing protein n=1 Tax=Riccia fluitans TaxID=41844 RepID=A0ABD1ZA75_9MARC
MIEADEIENAASHAKKLQSMDESPAMRECWEAVLKLQRASENREHNDQCHRGRSIENPRNVAQLMGVKRRQVANAINSIKQNISMVHHHNGFFQNGNNNHSEPSAFSFRNPLDSLSTFIHSVCEKVVSRMKQQDQGPLLASTSTTALAQLTSVATSGWSHFSDSDLRLDSWRRDPFFDAFLDGRDLEVLRQRRDRPTSVAEPSENTLLVAEEIFDRAVEGWSGFIRPVDPMWEVSSRFGPRWGRQHNGVDLAAPTGEPVLAADSGEVTYAGWEPGGYGNLVEITHRDGWKTLYAHNSKIFTWKGQLVRRGDCIATVGETGRATGPHLHWEIRDHLNKPIDPSDHINL